MGLWAERLTEDLLNYLNKEDWVSIVRDKVKDKLLK